MENINITPIVEAIVALASAVITCVFVPYIRNKVSDQKWATILKWIDTGVSMAQQVYFVENGEFRKQIVQEFLTKKGVDINLPEVDAAIEAAVLKLHTELQVAGSSKISTPQ